MAFGSLPNTLGGGGAASLVYLPGGGTITGASGAISFTASGTNQSITLTPSGSGSSVLDSVAGQELSVLFRQNGSTKGSLITSGGDVLFGTTGATNLIFTTSGAEKGRFFANGRLGIGTGATDSGALLQVNGTATFAGTIQPQLATTAGAPAYVKGAIYFDTTLNKLRVGGASAWETITSV
jgi:hypothetical protein